MRKLVAILAAAALIAVLAATLPGAGAEGIANAAFVVGVIVFLGLVLLVPGRGSFAGAGTQARRWRTFSRHGFYDPAAARSSDDRDDRAHA
ncbi:MAG TPA: hypothetical protein VGJ32_08800 [Solirubrobacteraceae bacterium]|jgi:hypothetical protein